MLSKKIPIMVGVLVLVVISAFLLVESYMGNERIGEHVTERKMRALQAELSRYYRICGEFPETLNEIGVSSNCSSFEPVDTEPGRLIDFWGNEFIYFKSPSGYRLLSAGRNWIEAREKYAPRAIK